MSRPLLAATLLLALAAGILAAWWLAEAPAPSDQAAPGAGPRGGGSPIPELIATGEDPRSRRETGAAGLDDDGSAGAGYADAEGLFAIEVLVVDPERSAVEGARVQVLQPEGSEASSDALGLARVDVPSGTRRVDLLVEAKGYFHSRVLRPVAARVEVTLHPATPARGRVLERDTLLPIEAAKVWLDDGHEGCEAQRVVTAADGSFELDEAPVGSAFALVASAAGFADGRAPYQLLPGGPSEGLEVVLERSAGLRLRIVDFLSGRPVPGARLASHRELPEADERGVIDAGRLVSALTRAVWIAVEAPGYCHLSRRLTPSDWQEGGPVQVALLEGARFEGVVRNEQGRPVAGAEVVLRRNVGPHVSRLEGSRRPASLDGWKRDWILAPERGEPVRAAADGRFVSLAVPPLLAGLELEVSSAGWTTRRLDPGEAPGPGQATWIDVQLEAERTGTIRGLLTLNGAPIGGTISWLATTTSGRGTADPSGRFLLTEVEAGEVGLRAAPADGAQRYGTLLDDALVSLRLEPGEELEQDIELTLPLAATAGHVRTQRGDGVVGVEVVAALAGRQASFQATTQADGRFELELPAVPEPWSLQVRGPWRTEAVDAHAGERDVLLLVTELGRLRLRLLDAADGRPMREFEVRGSAPGGLSSRVLGATWQNTPDPQGWIEVDAPSGSVDLVARPLDRSYPAARASVVVPPAGAPPRSVQLSSSRGSALVLVLLEDSDRPPRRSLIYLLDEDVAARLRLPEGGSTPVRWESLVALVGDPVGLNERRVAFDLDRRTTLHGLPGGRYRLVALDGGRFEPAQVELPRQAGAPLEVRWEPGP